MSAPWDRPCSVEGCDRTADHNVVGSRVRNGPVCRRHIPADTDGVFALND